MYRQTVSTWFYKWNTQGIIRLVDRPGRVRPFTLTEEQKTIALQHIKESPRSLNKVIADLGKEFDLSISLDILESFDWFTDQIEKPTTIIIDNASIHTSDEFNSHIEGWEKKDLKVYRLPTYSPELNIIEIVWRKIKYDWLPFDAYKSFADLKRELFDVLANIGISYNVDFS